MKKLVSVLCVLTLVLGMFAVSVVSTGAVDAAQTMVDVKKGDKVTYTLTLGGVELPIIGCDFSFYYDSSLFDLDSVADYNDKTNETEWEALINTQLDGQVRGNWSILKGVDFSTDRHFLTMNLTAKEDGTGHLSYFIRYMYDNNIFNSEDKPQITEYKFTCDVAVNGEKVLEKAEPELNVEETQNTGLFVNSITGDSNDADADIPGTVVKKNDTNSAVTGGNSNNGGSDNNVAAGGNSVSGGNNNGGGTGSGTVQATAASPATTSEGYFITATDASGKATATSDEAPITLAPVAGDTTDGGSKGGSSPVLWIIIALVVLAGGGAAVYFFMKKKPDSIDAPSNASTIEASDSNDNQE